MGADHAKIFAENIPGVTLQVICDMDEARARAVADTCGATDVSSQPEGVITRSDVDAVVIASPDFTHAPLSKACISMGKKVLCEKPLAQTSVECFDIMQAELAVGSLHVMLGFMRRYDQSYIEMKQAMTDGVLGRALMMHNFHRNVETPATDFSGAMAITNSAPHEFDIVRHVLDTEFTSIMAMQPKRSDGVVAPVVMILETANDQLVTIEVNNNAAYGYDVRAELVGEAGAIAMSNPLNTRTDLQMASSTRYYPDWRGRFHEAYVRQNRDFVTFVSSGSFPQIASDCWDGYRAATTAEAGVRSLNHGTSEAIPVIDKPRLYFRNDTEAGLTGA